MNPHEFFDWLLGYLGATVHSTPEDVDRWDDAPLTSQRADRILSEVAKIIPTGDDLSVPARLATISVLATMISETVLDPVVMTAAIETVTRDQFSAWARTLPRSAPTN
jgi:hypothetical protein